MHTEGVLQDTKAAACAFLRGGLSPLIVQSKRHQRFRKFPQVGLQGSCVCTVRNCDDKKTLWTLRSCASGHTGDGVGIGVELLKLRGGTVQGRFQLLQFRGACSYSEETLQETEGGK